MNKRKEVKAGKHERIRKLLTNLHATVVTEQPWLAEVLLQSRSSTPVSASTMNTNSASKE
jgi:hypothetical protein